MLSVFSLLHYPGACYAQEFAYPAWAGHALLVLSAQRRRETAQGLCDFGLKTCARS